MKLLGSLTFALARKRADLRDHANKSVQGDRANDLMPTSRILDTPGSAEDNSLVSQEVQFIPDTRSLLTLITSDRFSDVISFANEHFN